MSCVGDDDEVSAADWVSAVVGGRGCQRGGVVSGVVQAAALGLGR